MKRDEDKTKEQLIKELALLRQRITELEVSEAELKRMGEEFRREAGKTQVLIDGLARTGIAIDIVSNDYKILLKPGANW